MSDKPVFVHRRITSATGATAYSAPVYVGANTFSVHFEAPASLAGLEVSNDKANWITDTGSRGDSITSVTTRPLWARGLVATDTAGPRSFEFGFTVFKETE